MRFLLHPFWHAILFYIGLSLISLGIALFNMHNSPDGYEDNKGFHKVIKKKEAK